MNVIKLLKDQHREIKELLEKLSAGERRQRRATVGELAKALRLHTRLEEKFVYPAASRALQGEAQQELILLAQEEHGAAERALAALEGTSPGDKRFAARTKVLGRLVREHIDEEESQLLPDLESRLQEGGIDRLSGQIERRMAQVQAELAQQPAPESRATRATRVGRSAPPKKPAHGGDRRQPGRRMLASARGTGRSEPRASNHPPTGSRSNPARARRGESG